MRSEIPETDPHSFHLARSPSHQRSAMDAPVIPTERSERACLVASCQQIADRISAILTEVSPACPFQARLLPPTLRKNTSRRRLPQPRFVLKQLTPVFSLRLPADALPPDSASCSSGWREITAGC